MNQPARTKYLLSCKMNNNQVPTPTHKTKFLRSFRFRDKFSYITSMYLAKDNVRLGIGGSGYFKTYPILIISLQSGETLQELYHHSDVVSSLYLQEQTLITTSNDATIIVWDLSRSSVRFVLSLAPFGFRAFPFTACDANLKLGFCLVGSENCTITKWDTNAGRFVRSCLFHEERITAVKIVDGGENNIAVSSSIDGKLIVSNHVSGVVLQQLDEVRNILSMTLYRDIIITTSIDCFARRYVYANKSNTFVGNTMVKMKSTQAEAWYVFYLLQRCILIFFKIFFITKKGAAPW